MAKRRGDFLAILLFCGMLAFIAYVSYAALGNRLWPEYDPITMDISSLGAQGAPNQQALAPLLAIYGYSFLLFTASYVWLNFKRSGGAALKTGSVLLFIMSLVSKFGYSLFPLTGDKAQMSFQNMMHILVTVAVVFLSVAALYCLAFGYRKRLETRHFGSFMLAAATFFTLAGITNPIGMALGLNVLGLTERAAIYSLHLILGIVGLWEGMRLLKVNGLERI